MATLGVRIHPRNGWNPGGYGDVVGRSRTIWWAGTDVVGVIDQTRLPHESVVAEWRTLDDACRGITDMQVRGAPLIGVAAAHGMALAMRADPTDPAAAAARLAATRPTAVNLRWAVDRVLDTLASVPREDRWSAARHLATSIADDDVAACHRIGVAGLDLLASIRDRNDRAGRADDAIHVLTHCNAGRLACVDWGTATAPVYLAHERGLPVHVWVSETRPRNQGAALTAWELAEAGVPHTLVVDNAAGHLLATGEVDVVIVGADRIAANGDVVNKIGTSLKALAARHHGVPFVVAAPWSTIDPTCADGRSVPIEERDVAEVLELAGVPVAPPRTAARNWGFDVTPAALVDRYLTDTGPLDAATLASLASRVGP